MDIPSQKEESVCSPCLTVLEGRSWPLLTFSLAVCRAADRNSSAFMHNTKCSAKLKRKRVQSPIICDTELEEQAKLHLLSWKTSNDTLSSLVSDTFMKLSSSVLLLLQGLSEVKLVLTLNLCLSQTSTLKLSFNL